MGRDSARGVRAVILVTVGAQMPFDRLIRAVDAWAAETGRTDVFAQIGPGAWQPRHIEWTDFLSPADFRARVQRASLLVAHAGMGSILTALELGRPILVMPRRGDLMETRNDHQVATAVQFEKQGRVAVAMDEKALVQRLSTMDIRPGGAPISRHASPSLIHAIRSFIGLPSAAPAAEAGQDRYVPDIVTRPTTIVTSDHHEHV